MTNDDTGRTGPAMLNFTHRPLRTGSVDTIHSCTLLAPVLKRGESQR